MTPANGRLLWVAAGAFLLGVVAVVIVLLMRRDEAAPPPVRTAQAAVPAPPPEPADIRSRPAAAQLAAAFEAAFHGRPPATRMVGDNEIVYRPARLLWIGERAVLVSAGANSFGCHVCAGLLAVHYLEPQGSGFRVTGEWLDGGGSGSWGQPPDWQFSTLLSPQPMIRNDGGDGGQGYFCTWIQFRELALAGPHEIANVQTGYSDTGALREGGTPPTEFEGAIRNVVGGRSFDVVYRVRNFALQRGAFVPAGSRRLTEHYVLRGGRYVLSRGETRVPTC